MNKLIGFPIVFMMLLTIISFFLTPGFDFNSHYDPQTGGSSNVNGTDVTFETGQNSLQVNVFAIAGFAAGFMVLLTAAIAIGVAGGINAFGSGLNPGAVKILFNSVIWIGLWTILSIVPLALIAHDAITTMVWIIVSLMYCVGVGFHMGGSATFEGS